MEPPTYVCCMETSPLPPCTSLHGKKIGEKLMNLTELFFFYVFLVVSHSGIFVQFP